MNIKHIIALLLLTLSLDTVQAQDFFKKPARGFFSEKPATNWQDALLSGNGTMGVLIPGGVDTERITINHDLLYLPGKVSGTYVKQGERMNEIRAYLLKGSYREAGLILAELKKDAGYFDNRDPYVPGFNLKIEQNGSATTQYQRSVNYETGEAGVVWKNAEGTFLRRTFVSRADSLVILSIKGTGKINATFSFEPLPTLDAKDSALVANGFKQVIAGLTNSWLTFQAVYKNTNPYAPFAGYQGAGKLINKGGSVRYEGNRAIVTNAEEVLVLVKLNPVIQFTGKESSPIQAFISSKPADYDRLLSQHVKIHSGLFNTVKLDLDGDPTDRNLSTEALIQKSRIGSSAPAAMIEKAFDAGRYNIISSTGSNPPNLIGLWSGIWLSPWSGSFTTNGNVQTAIAFLLQGNTPSLMKAYFNMNDRLLEGYRRNAKELFNCRGIHIPAQMTTTPLETDFNPAYPHSYWTGGAGWAANYYFDYYQYTGDKQFLQTKGYPFMKEAALFLEDFLKLEKDGKVVFAPSYSPENAPGNHKNVPTSINATMDVMITRQLLRNCIKAAGILKTDAAKVSQWETMLSKLPAYEITKEGALREWLWPGEEENYEHRHASHLYALYDDLPEEFKSDSLRKAVAKTIAIRFDFHKNKGHGFMSFGIAHLGWAAAHIGDARQASLILDYLAANYWSVGMASYHNMHSLFNMDISGGFPYLVAQCLAQSEPGKLSLLPALPERWKKGRINGLQLRGNVNLKELSWAEKTLTVVLHPGETTTVQLKLPGIIKTVNGASVQATSVINGYSASLKKGIDTRLVISFE